MRAVGLSRRLQAATMSLPGRPWRGKHPQIFKRFYWWEDDCVDNLRDAFGVTVERRSYRELWARAAGIPSPVSGPRSTTLRTRCLCSGLPARAHGVGTHVPRPARRPRRGARSDRRGH